MAICRTAVRFVEQVYQDLHGPDKLRQAMAKASELLAGYGITITEEELVAAKQGLISALQGVHDSPGGIEDYYSVMHLTQAKLTPQEYLEAVEQVDKDQVVEAARTLTLHTEYVLKGVQ